MIEQPSHSFGDTGADLIDDALVEELRRLGIPVDAAEAEAIIGGRKALAGPRTALLVRELAHVRAELVPDYGRTPE